MKIIPIFILIILAGACSSSYTPSAAMLDIKKNMTIEQAQQVAQTSIWNVKDLKGICGSRGFWYDDQSHVLVHEDKISLLAHKRGRQLRKLDQGFSGIVVFEKQYYKYDFEFNKISNINIYNNPARLPTFPGCNKKDLNEDSLIIDLYGDELNNFKFIVYEKDFDKVMAALTILIPDKPVKIK